MYINTWDKARVAECEALINAGARPRYHPFYDRDPELRGPKVAYNITHEELEEYESCGLEIEYYAKNFVFIKDEDGARTLIEPRDYQVEAWEQLEREKYNLFMWSRQTAKTITSVIFILWYVSFHTRKNVLIVANMGDTVKEIVDKIKQIYRLVPFHLKPGIVRWNERSIEFDNGCRIITARRGKTPGVGTTIDLLYLDEFAHIDENLANAYYRTVIPTVSSISTSKIIISSTPNGDNLFKRLVDGAMLPKSNPLSNPYMLKVVYWHQVKGRGEKWRQEQTRLIGGEENFKQEFDLLFNAGGNTLLDSVATVKLQNTKVAYMAHTLDVTVGLYNQEEADETDLTVDLFLAPDIEPESLITLPTLVTLDPGEGLGANDSTILLFKLRQIPSGQIQLVQYGKLSSNTWSAGTLTRILYHVTHKLLNPETTKLVVEINRVGDTVISLLPYVDGDNNNFEASIVVNFPSTTGGTDFRPGLRTTKNKHIMLRDFKEDIITDLLLITEPHTILELSRFTRRITREGKMTFKADTGGDDHVMAAAFTACFRRTVEFMAWVEECLEGIFREMDTLTEEVPEIEYEMMSSNSLESFRVSQTMLDLGQTDMDYSDQADFYGV